jgi:2-polyprenyl-3-methyl-5-hydroxy-6-metoxy-1,4-benzoquinol methylase
VASNRVSSYTSRRPDLVPLMPWKAERVLDIGCSNGAFGAEVKRLLGATVVGIEIDPDFAREAEDRIDRVVCGDALRALDELSGERFDCVVCADVLEHLADPDGVLTALRELLSAGATVVVSLPNVRFYDTFVQLGLRGRWPERERGVHDRTHLRWFTDANARALFARTRYRVVRSGANYRLRDSPGARVNRFASRLARGPLRPFLAYQLLYALTPEPGRAV